MVRWIRADLRASTGQALAVVLVVAGVVAALLLSAAMLEGATNPWQGLFTATRGAQIWMHLAPGTDTARLRSQVPGIQSVAGPYQATAATLVQPGQQTRVELQAMAPAQRPGSYRPLRVDGSWLQASEARGVVLEATFAQAMRVSVGDEVVLDNVDGTKTLRVEVIGLAETAEQGFYPDQTPGLVWVLPALLRRIVPDQDYTEQVVGLRIANPDATAVVVQQVVTQLGSSAVGSVSTWQQVEQSMARRDPLLGLLLALFGLVALGAAVLAVVNVSSGRVLVQHAELGMLQTLGFTPLQVMAMLTAEHAILTCAGILVGLAAARLLAPMLVGAVPGVTAAGADVPVGWALLILGGILAAVVLATALPGWRAGRMWPVAAVRAVPPRGHLSRLAATAMAARMPPAMVLGARAAFVRRMSAVLTICGLAVPMLMITIGLGFWATLDQVQQHPAEIGLASSITVGPGPLTLHQADALIRRDPDVQAAYKCVKVVALVPGETTTITTLGMGTSTQPYPFEVVQGHLYHAPEQAVATQALLDALRLHVGQFVRMYFGGVPVTFRIVGRIIDPQYDSEVLAYGYDTLGYEGAAAPIAFYSLVLRPGVAPAAAAARLLRMSGGRLNVELVSNPADQLGIVRAALAALIVVLTLTGLTSLQTASRVGSRDHERDVRVLHAMGLTPVQVRTAVVVRTTVLALVAVTLGAMVGVAASGALVSAVSRLFGLGTGLGSAPPAGTVAAAMALAVGLATVVGALTTRSADRAPVAVVLGP
ncbi:MAG TPA: FtsX-like permease family protein [Streptosporangiaceae bacterium]|nr:FtsX-like permease family protein [Streptosporangiaceae bacterium]